MLTCKVCGKVTDGSTRDWFFGAYEHLQKKHSQELSSYVKSCTGLDEDTMSKFIVAANFFVEC